MRTALVLLPALLFACTGERHPTGSPGDPLGEAPRAPALALELGVTEAPGLTMRLSEGSAPTASSPAVGADPKRATGPLGAPSELAASRVSALLDRVPPLPEPERVAFAKRADSQPPPRTGANVQLPWPPPPSTATPPRDERAPLQVTRHAPEGEVSLAPHLSVSFNHPMVAVTSQEEAAKTVPVVLTPQPPGSWRWLGTQTLLFDPDPRFPMASEFTVEIPAGTQSVSGDVLPEAVRWSFGTPPPSVNSVAPYDGPIDLRPLVFVGFDQRVDERVLDFVSLKAGGQRVPLRVASEARIAEDVVAQARAKSAEPGRFVLLEPTTTLKPATTYTIEVARGAPSAEGPRTTTTTWSEAFFTYEPLRVDRATCYRDVKDCQPGSQMSVELNNPLDVKAFAAEAWTVSPAIEHLRISASGSWVTLAGDTKARTTYTVTVPASLRDTFGQQLGRDGVYTFTYGNADPSLQGPGKEMVVLDPAAPPAFSVYSTNHRDLKLRVFEVGTEQLSAVSAWLRDARYDAYRRGEPPAKRVANSTMHVDGYKPDELVETAIDLKPWLNASGKGQLLVWIEPTTQPAESWRRTDIFAWVQVTDIGLTAYVDQANVLGWATSLLDGAPLAGVQLELLGRQGSVATDASGLANVAPYDSGDGPHALVARRGDDVAILPGNDGWWNQYGSWTRRTSDTTMRWFTFDDRRMYRPGETVQVKGWVRRFDTKPLGQLGAYQGQPTALAWTLYDSRNNKLSEGEGTLSEFGGFDLGIDLPGTPNLGRARLELRAKDSGMLTGGYYQHLFQIQEFRRPEFEVSVAADPRPYVLGEHAFVSVDARYFAGGALPNAETSWTVTASPASFSPPGWSGWAFGEYIPWWRGGGPSGATQVETLQGQTDVSGAHHLQIDFLAMNPPRPMSVVAEASVMDVNRQRWSASQALLLHPSSLYIGVKPDKGFYAKDDAIEVLAAVVGLDGAAVEGIDGEVRFARMTWKQQAGVWSQVEESPTTCKVHSAKEPQPCHFTTSEGGEHVLIASVTDAQGRPSQTRQTVYVAGGKQRPNRAVAMEAVTLIPERASYQPGDVARVLVQAPFAPAHGLWSVRRNGQVETHAFDVDGATYTIELPITEDHVPNVIVDVDLVGSTPRTGDDGAPLLDRARRVAFASGAVTLPVPPLSRTLTVEVSPRDAVVLPGGSTAVNVRVTDAAGKPVQAEVALVVADEAVLALTNATLPDPIAVFYAQQGAGVVEAHLRSQVVLADPLSAMSESAREQRANEVAAPAMQQIGGLMGSKDKGLADGDMAMAEAAPRSMKASAAGPTPPPPPSPAGMARGGGAPASAAAPIAVRSDFTATALFAPHVLTDADGRATVPLPLPDSLTRYRVMAVAVDRDRSFGAGESTVTARKPLMLRPSPPRFLNFGDRMELPIVVQNQTDQPMNVELALRVANALVLSDLDADLKTGRATAGRRFTVAANDRREVRVPVAADRAGKASFQVVAVTAGAEDAASFDLPVWTPATSEAFATYGTLDAGSLVQPVKAPGDVWPQFGGVEVTTSSTALQALTDALLALQQYPYECNEQISSRVMAIVALRDVLTAFEAAQLPSPEALNASVEADTARLVRRQYRNGGFGFWGGSEDYPYVSVHVTHTLVRAQREGYAVDAQALSRALQYVRSIESHIPGWYSQEARWSIIAYSVYVRHLYGEEDLDRALRLMGEGTDRLPLEAQGWILPTLHAQGRADEVAKVLRHLENRATETAATAMFTGSYGDTNDYVLLHSDRRTDAVLLEAMLEVQPDHPLIPKVVQGLLDHRVKGAWGTTQENAFVLLAMNRYFRVAEAKTPDFVARVWLGDDFAGEHVFKGRTTERANIDVPMDLLAATGGAQDLVLGKEGPGRLYYRVGMRYAPKSLVLEPADYGFAVERRYEAIDDPGQVRRDDDGVWHIAAGARVRVRVTMVATSRRTHVALVDPMPGGFEAMNPELATTGTIPADPSALASDRYWWWHRTWYEHTNLRDERAEAFASLLWDGVHELTYVATATTPGRFVVPPPKAEEMYHPETFGRGATDRVVIE